MTPDPAVDPSTGRTFRVIGRGRAGGSVALALASVGWTELPALGRGDDVSRAGEGVDLLVIATPDSDIADVAAQVEPGEDTVVVHLAGSRGVAELSGHPRVGALHPLMTLPSAEIGAPRLRGDQGPVWFAVAGDPLVTEIVEQLGGRSFTIDDDDRARYHATAAVASNHLVALLGQVERLAELTGVPFEAYLDLARASLANVGDLGPATALTGPAARGDAATIDAHLEALPPDERDLYLALARAAATLAGRDL
jgi:predicted short-subunit dehydrogenase-like oxidoreductase (DUF2520 family)